MKKITLDDFVKNVLFENKTASSNADRNIEIAMSYYGLNGTIGASMNSVGKTFNLTRESVRIISNDAQFQLQNSTVYPHINDIVKVINENTPSSAHNIEVKLFKKGLISSEMKIEGVYNYLRIIRNKYHDRLDLETVNDRIKYHEDTRFLLSDSNSNLIKSIESFAIAEISHNGFCSTDDLIHVCQSIPETLQDSFIKDSVNSISRVIWIDEKHFFFGDSGRNRVLARIKQVLSTQKDVPLDLMHEGLTRAISKNSEKGKTKFISKEILSALLKCHQNFYIHDGIINCHEDYSMEEFNKPTDLKIFKVLSTKENFEIREKALEDEVNDDSKNRYSFSISLMHSPIIHQLDKDGNKKRGMYRLLGSPKH